MGLSYTYARRVPIPTVDPDRPPTRLKRLLTPFALSRPGTWYGINVAARIDPKLMRLTRGRVNLGGNVLPTLLLTTRGRKSGVERTVPLVYFSDGDDVILMASSFGRPRYPAWYHNLKANPAVTIERGAESFEAIATIPAGEERDQLWAWVTRQWPLLVEHQQTARLPLPLVVFQR